MSNNIYVPDTTSYPLNPGVRAWENVKPNRYIPRQSKYPVYNSGINSRARVGGCPYRQPYIVPVGGQRIESFGTINTLINLFVLVAVCYFIYFLINRNR